MKIAIMFGSFNPITNAHVAAMKSAPFCEWTLNTAKIRFTPTASSDFYTQFGEYKLK